MVANTINELITLLDQVDQDATVLAAIANDSPTTTTSGSGPGLVTTRLGSSVKNVQKLLADIENGIADEVRPDIQDEGLAVLNSPGVLNFVGSNLTVTDVGGVATITLDGEVSTVGTPSDQEIGVWTGNGTLKGDSNFTWDGTNLSATANVDTSIGVTQSTGSVNLVMATRNLSGGVGYLGTNSSHDVRFITGGTSRVALDTNGNLAIGTNDTSNAFLTLNTNNPDIRFDDDSSSSITTITSGSAFTVDVDNANAVANSEIVFNVDGNEVFKVDDQGVVSLKNDGYLQSRRRFANKSTTSYTLQLEDLDSVIAMTNASANTLNIPLESSVDFPDGTLIRIAQGGSGITTISAPTGVLLNGVNGGSADLTGQYTFTSILKAGPDVWYISGDNDPVS